MTLASKIKLTKANCSINTPTKKVFAGLLIGIASFYAPTLNAAPIYKVVDEKTGQVTFTDNPQSYEQQAGKQISQTSITTGNSTNHSNNQPNNNQSGNNNAGSTLNAQAVKSLPEMTTAPSASRAINYQLAIIEPSEARAYRRPAQSIVVQAQTRPALQVGDSASIYLDGDFIALGLSASIATVDILPGEHSVQVVIKNKKGQVVQQVARTVYVIQNTARIQANKRIAEQLLAYERLSWPQKILLKLRQDNKNPIIQSAIKSQADTPMTLEIPAIQ